MKLNIFLKLKINFPIFKHQIRIKFFPIFRYKTFDFSATAIP